MCSKLAELMTIMLFIILYLNQDFLLGVTFEIFMGTELGLFFPRKFIHVTFRNKFFWCLFFVIFKIWVYVIYYVP